MPLEKRYGVRGHDFDGIFFTEDSLESAVTLGMVQAVSNKQNTSLDALKSTMARDAKSKGGNVVSSFKYGQKGTAFSFSSTQWNASGVVNLLVDNEATDNISTEMSPSVKAGQCPMCMEEIHPDARKCKHCGEIFA
jgi:hypothetical protein